MALRPLEPPRNLLTRILETPDLARVVQGLEPALLHQLVRKCGLEDSGQIIALASTEQLMRVFDVDLWRSETTGGEEQLDVDRFGLWLEVLAEAGADVAAKKIAEMDFDFVTAALSRHLLVLDAQSLALERMAAEVLDEADETEEARLDRTESALENGLSYDVGGYKVVARRGESWDALLAVLTSLDASHPAFFGRLMARCSVLASEYIVDNGGLYEVLTSEEQVLADVAAEREGRRAQEGYVAPPGAAAFLTLVRRPIGKEAVPPAWDHLTAGYFRDLDRRAKESGEEVPKGPAPRSEGQPSDPTELQVRRFLAMLQDTGVLPASRVPLLPKGASGERDRLSRIRTRLLEAQEHDPVAYARRTEELGYLANILIAGCSFQSRRFRTIEAADAVLAACNLGLENWPRHWPEAHDLVTVFRAGWSVGYERACLHVARRLAEILAHLETDDADIRHQLVELRGGLESQVKAGTPWRERDNLDVIAVLDPPSWSTLLGLLDECPVVPKASNDRSGRPALRVTTEFEFVSENSQVAWIRDFLEALPGRLAG
jgi:Family of unknown function (DUF6178)